MNFINFFFNFCFPKYVHTRVQLKSTNNNKNKNIYVELKIAMNKITALIIYITSIIIIIKYVYWCRYINRKLLCGSGFFCIPIDVDILLKIYSEFCRNIFYVYISIYHEVALILYTFFFCILSVWNRKFCYIYLYIL